MQTIALDSSPWGAPFAEPWSPDLGKLRDRANAVTPAIAERLNRLAGIARRAGKLAVRGVVGLAAGAAGVAGLSILPMTADVLISAPTSAAEAGHMVGSSIGSPPSESVGHVVGEAVALSTEPLADLSQAPGSASNMGAFGGTAGQPQPTPRPVHSK